MDTTVEPILREKCSKDFIRPAIVQSSKENAEEETSVKLLTDHKEFVNSLRRTKQPWKVPWFIVIMCSLQISLYLMDNRCIRQHLMFMPNGVNEYWRYFTYMLLHSDILHLTMNICLQLVIAFCLESEQSHWKVATIYISGGISGSLATRYLQPELSLMGASAGVYALLMSHIPHLLKNFPSLAHRYLRIMALMILFLSDICFTTFHIVINQNTNPRICVEAHVAGALFGLIFGFFIY
ncbi:protein rhomboid [Musca domestica]|uniref:Protein rhomboid n=1 Tax=Musca domestica TaxID=7370 RepID=A0A1I8MUD1_MUSDO|nr:protein rhomboid [Musca domestica]